MFRINTKSIIFKTAIIYVFITLFNITIFDLMVYENQIDLIFQNSVLTSKNKASNLKYQIDQVVNNAGALDVATINAVLKAANSLNIRDLTLFDENGAVFVCVKNNQIAQRNKADMHELKMINMAITKQGFEDKIFYHDVDRQKRTIDLYTPFTYAQDKIAVAAIRLGMTDLDKQMRLLVMQCLIIAALVIVLHVGFAWIFSKMLLIPLRKLNEATKKIAQGELDIRVSIVREDEIGALASSFNEMSVALQRMRDEAKGANPLTGLPGNITIAKHIDDCLMSGQMMCVLYCDLDNFKAYNDKYGFTKGDEAILYTRDCLIAVAQKKGMLNVFVGHEGGDDFVVVCDYEYWENFAKAFITTFDRGIYQFYNSIDARNGFIESVNRKGERQRFPLMSVSIAVVTNKTRPFKRHAEMIQVAAEVKKYVKSIDGSCYAIDRRQGPITATTAASPAVAPQVQRPSAPTPDRRA
jgi:GGDEF domain-containing protein